MLCAEQAMSVRLHTHIDSRGYVAFWEREPGADNLNVVETHCVEARFVQTAMNNLLA